jgi:hypothetical protein
MAARDPDHAHSDRVVWIVRTPEDVGRAIWLLRLAYLICRRSSLPSDSGRFWGKRFSRDGGL